MLLWWESANSRWRMKELVKTKKIFASLWLGNSQTVSILLLRDKTLLLGQFTRGTTGVGVIPSHRWLASMTVSLHTFSGLFATLH